MSKIRICRAQFRNGRFLIRIGPQCHQKGNFDCQKCGTDHFCSVKKKTTCWKPKYWLVGLLGVEVHKGFVDPGPMGTHSKPPKNGMFVAHICILGQNCSSFSWKWNYNAFSRQCFFGRKRQIFEKFKSFQKHCPIPKVCV